MKLMKLKPSDNTFFRDGKVFKRGYNHLITSKNIPYLSVFFGALFSSFLAENPMVAKRFLSQKFKEGDDRHKILTIGQIYLYHEGKKAVYIPAPKDLFLDMKGTSKFGEFKKYARGLHSLPYDYILMPPKEGEVSRVRGEFINIKRIPVQYKNKSNVDLNLKNEKAIFKKNYKVGIGSDYHSRMVKEDLLYRIEQTEFESNEWSFILEYELDSEYIKFQYGTDVKEPDQGYLKLGGENKPCKYQRVSNRHIEEFQHFKAKSISNSMEAQTLKIVFTTDVYFKDSERSKSFFQNRVIGMSNEKPVYIGGFDMNKGVKPMFKGYGAGTVFLVKNEKEMSLEEELNDLIGASRLEGFGQYFILEEKYE